MNFSLESITAVVKHIAARLLPGWDVRVKLASSIEEIGALAYVQAFPEREIANVTVAPHPPDEKLKESIAHELTHAVISPLTRLIEFTPATVMIEEQIVERLGKFIADATPELLRGVASALRNPRTSAPLIRKRISALATRQRIAGRKRNVDPKMIEEIIAAIKEGNGEAAIELLTKLLASAAGGGTGSDDGAAREDKSNDESAVAPMREDQMPAEMRAQYRTMKRTTAMSLDSAIRMRIHEARTIDGLNITPSMETKLRRHTTVESFEAAFELLKEGLAGSTQQRNRSGVEPEGQGNRGGSPSLEQLRREYPEQVANDIHRAFERGADHGDVAMKAAAKFRKAAGNG